MTTTTPKVPSPKPSKSKRPTRTEIVRRTALARLYENEYKFWFRQHYNLPPNDPRFLEADDLEIEIDFFMHAYYAEYQKGSRKWGDSDLEFKTQGGRLHSTNPNLQAQLAGDWDKIPEEYRPAENEYAVKDMDSFWEDVEKLETEGTDKGA